MEAFKVRLVHERKALSNKVLKLLAFVTGAGGFNSLHEQDKTDLRNQLTAMQTYLSILESRMEKLGISSDVRTYGQKIAGVGFNPSSDPDVDAVKDLYAEVVDVVNINSAISIISVEDIKSEKSRYFLKALNHLEDSQMNAVKGITWKN